MGPEDRRASTLGTAFTTYSCRMPRIHIALALFALHACAPQPAAVGHSAASSGAPRGSLQIVGGGPQPRALVQQFVSLAGGPGGANILVFAMASAAGERSGEAKAADLRELGARARNVWITREQADVDSVVALVDSATGIWFGGGDQNRLARALRGTRVEAAIRRRYHDGAVVGGTSAGAAVLSAVMITGSERRPGGARRDTINDFITIDRDNIGIDSGFALVDNAVIDQQLRAAASTQPPHQSRAGASAAPRRRYRRVDRATRSSGWPVDRRRRQCRRDLRRESSRDHRGRLDAGSGEHPHACAPGRQLLRPAKRSREANRPTVADSFT